MDELRPVCKWYLLDDDVDDIQIFEDAIRVTGLPVQLASFNTGNELMQHLKESSLPNVIILDINLPMQNGIEILSILKSNERLRSLPVVMLTSSGFSKNEIESLRLGAVFYLTKPDRFANYDQIVQQVYSLCLEPRMVDY